MSDEEVRRSGVLKRVKAGELTQVEAAEMLALSYRQLKRLYGRFVEGGAKALVHRSAGKPSNRARPAKERKQVLTLVRKHYGGGPGERFGPTPAAEHLQEDHGITVDPETLRRWMLAEGLWSKENGSASRIGSGACVGRTLANWCRWMAVSRTGWKIAGRAAASSTW